VGLHHPSPRQVVQCRSGQVHARYMPGACQVHVRMCRSGQVHVHAPGGNQLDADERQGSCCCTPKNLFAAACSPKSGAVTKVICILAGIHHELLGHTAAQHARATHATSRFTGHKIKRQLYTRDTGAWKSTATVITIVAIMVVAVSLAVRVARHTSGGMWHGIVCVCVRAHGIHGRRMRAGVAPPAP
jgi:hypothetical protein